MGGTPDTPLPLVSPPSNSCQETFTVGIVFLLSSESSPPPASLGAADRTVLHSAITHLTFLSEFCPAHLCSCSLQRAPDAPSATARGQSRTLSCLLHTDLKGEACFRHKWKGRGRSEQLLDATFLYALGENSPCSDNSRACSTHLEAIPSPFLNLWNPGIERGRKELQTAALCLISCRHVTPSLCRKEVFNCPHLHRFSWLITEGGGLTLSVPPGQKLLVIQVTFSSTTCTCNGKRQRHLIFQRPSYTSV